MATSEARLYLRSQIRAEVDGQSEVNLPDLAQTILERFEGEQHLVRSFLQEKFYPMIYDEARAFLKQTRGFVELGEDMVSTTVLADKAADFRTKFRSRFDRWMEHAGERHVRLLDMTRDDLLLAASEREIRGSTELRIAALWRSLAAELRDGQKVSDRFTVDQIKNIESSISEKGEAAA